MPNKLLGRCLGIYMCDALWHGIPRSSHRPVSQSTQYQPQKPVPRSRNVYPLEELLAIMLEEADPRLPPGTFSLDAAVARHLGAPPARDGLLAALRAAGFAAARSHLDPRDVRTDACMADLLRVAEAKLGARRGAPWA
jgi:hypothetical protein